MSTEFDNKMSEHTDTLRIGQLIAIETIITDIDVFNYDTVAQVKGALASHKERLEGEQYERDANTDHVTEQIPNV